MLPYREITEEEWVRIEPMLHDRRRRRDSRGRPTADLRAVLNGVLWVLRSGSTWSELPRTYPPYQTCHRWFKVWHTSGVFRQVASQLVDLASDELCSTAEGRTRSTTRSRATSPQHRLLPTSVWRV